VSTALLRISSRRLRGHGLLARPRGLHAHDLAARREPSLVDRADDRRADARRRGGVFVAPPAQALFEVELDAVERAIERLAPGEVAGGAIGLIVGLLVAFLAKSVLFEFIANAGPRGRVRRERASTSC
jgi:hypothetical protein